MMRLIDESLWSAAIYAVEYLNDTSLLRKLIAEAEEPTIEAEPVRHGKYGACKTHDNGYGRINLYSGGGWQTAICKGVGNYEMVISHNGDHFATRIEYCPYCGERLDVE